jgi:hypothetical protein
MEVVPERAVLVPAVRMLPGRPRRRRVLVADEALVEVAQRCGAKPAHHFHLEHTAAQ